MRVMVSWLAEAEAAIGAEAWCLSLATSTPRRGPSARTVLVTAADAHGLRFHTSVPTGKTDDLAVDGRVAGVFHWPALARQLTLTGRTEELDGATSRRAFARRPRALQLTAWLYDRVTSGSAEGRSQEEVYADLATTYAETEPVRPPSWTTYQITPLSLAFWQRGGDAAPNTRVRYRRADPRSPWHGQIVLP